ncbi:LacI family DNA-binding transcriptional regulator [Bifidobacterium xylocopae]|uniref:LacI family transcriptional regulator n=1 Tax=Bifidobacterium xylocopae TaxID=2493119 RepID=A0A366KD33_9BIFI|nr:LacI family DNA-binding transcriptional regulator [Bifidobacterium xylocopae]RBP99023.1 LacI family transcriptional regulator [Bifidobacterium xylocopae]
MPSAGDSSSTQGGGKVGVADIAQKAGVSLGTVSNYLNYPNRVSQTLKERIKAAIDELGYVPRPARGAAALTGQSTIGIIMTDIEHSLFTAVFEGAQEVCEDDDLQLIGANAFSDSRRQSSLLKLFYSLGVKGVILCSVVDCEADMEWARSVGLNVVLVDHAPPSGGPQACSVLEDNDSVGVMAADHLLAAGCKRIAFVAHSFDYQSIYDRYRGVERALLGRSGINLSVIDSHGIMEEDGTAVGATINKLGPQEVPDGIVAGTDNLGIGIITALRDGGRYRVPKDIKVIGTEGVRLDSYPPVPLSTVAAPGIDMGRKAAALLLDEIGNRRHVHGTVLIKPTLVPRASTFVGSQSDIRKINRTT